MRRNLGKKPWFYPLPVLIIGTYDENGVPDAMNAAYGGLYTSNMVEFCISHDRKTFKNIMETKAFTVSFADAENMVPSDYVGLVSGNDTPDKMEKAGWTITPSEFVNAPLFEELPVTWGGRQCAGTSGEYQRERKRAGRCRSYFHGKVQAPCI